MEPIFKASYMLNTINVSVYPDRIVYQTGIAHLKKEEIILINQIADVEIVSIMNEVKIRTTGGREYKLIVKGADKEKVRDIILQRQQSIK